MQIIHHCLVTRFNKTDDNGRIVCIEEFKGIDLIELLSEPFLCEDEKYKAKNGDYGWTFKIKWFDESSDFYKFHNGYSDYLRTQLADEIKEWKSNKKQIAKLEEEYRLKIEEHEKTIFEARLIPYDENGNAYSEEHVRNIYNQIVEIKKLYSK